MNFQPLEVVYCCSETQLQVTENSNWIAKCSKGWAENYVSNSSFKHVKWKKISSSSEAHGQSIVISKRVAYCL